MRLRWFTNAGSKRDEGFGSVRPIRPTSRKLTVRAAELATGVAASEFSRIRNVRLERFTIDRMITILGKLGQEVEVSVNVRPRVGGLAPAAG